MKKRLTKGEMLLFTTPLLFLVLVGLFWQRQKNVPISIDFPVSIHTIHLEFSPDGKRLVSIFQDNGTFQYFGRVYDLETRSEVCNIAMPAPSTDGVSSRFYTKPSWSPDGESIALAVNTQHSGVGNFQIWDAQTGTAKASYPYTTREEMSTSVHFSPNGKTLIAEGGSTAHYDAATGKLLVKSNVAFVNDVVAKLNDKLALLAFPDPPHKSFRVVDTRTKRPVWESPIGEVQEFQWAGDILLVKGRQQIGKGRYENHLFLWNGKTRQLLPSPPISSDAEMGAFSFNSDQTTFTYTDLKANNGLVDGPTDFESELVSWDYRKNRVLWRSRVPSAVFSMQWSPDGQLLQVLAGTGEDYQNRLLIFDKNGHLKRERQPVRFNTCWSSDSKQLAVDVEELDNNKNTGAQHLEIHRFED